MSEHHLANRQEYALRRVVLGDVGRNLNDLERLEVNPHRVRWVREPSVSKRVCHDKITELVVDRAVRHRKDRQHAEACNNTQDTDRYRGEPEALREPGTSILEA